MAIIKCKMCGGDLVLTKGSTIATCEYCGSQQTVPLIDDDKKARLYNRANRYRMDSEFDRAYAAYENIVNDAPEEAEAYWGMLLSEYGVEYVDDPKMRKKVPTCHRTLVRSVTSSENFKSACRYADAESRMVYEDEAQVLDALQKRVLNASAKEEPYDVFICYKETDENGERTADSVLAQEIYDALSAKNLRVFFSRISLEDKLGEDYEPCIFAALNSAKVMLVVTTDSDRCNAVWVKNEWKRYLDFMKTDPSKTLIPVYKDISPYTLPDDFGRFQAQDMGKLGAMQDLVRGVEKLTGKGKKNAPGGMTSEEKNMVARIEKSQRRTRAILLSILFAIVFSLSECLAFAFWVDSYMPDSIASSIAVLLVGVFLGIGLAMNCTYGLKSRSAHWLYLAGTAIIVWAIITIALQNTRPFALLYYALTLFSILTGVTGISAYRKQKKLKLAHSVSLALLIVTALIFAFSFTSRQQRRAERMLNVGDYDAAYQIFANIGQSERITENRYQRAQEYLEQKEYDRAYEILESLGDNVAIQENRYQRALDYIGDESYAEAYFLLRDLKYRNSEELLTQIQKLAEKRVLQCAQQGSVVCLGCNADGTPLEWTVLDRTGNRMLLHCNSIVATMPYDEGETWHTEWETCSLCAYLNDEFIKTTFTDEERTWFIRRSNQTAPHEWIFILSTDQIAQYSSFITASDDTFWTLSPYNTSAFTAYCNVYSDTYYDFGCDSPDVAYGIRPAVRIDLSEITE